MNRAAEELRFEEAALLRDEITELRPCWSATRWTGPPVLPGGTADIEATLARPPI